MSADYPEPSTTLPSLQEAMVAAALSAAAGGSA